MSKIVIRAGVILTRTFQKDGKDEIQFLILKGNNTYDSIGKWGFPKGHMEPIDENDPIKTALRELEEETNIIIAREAVDSKNTFKIDHDTLIFYYIDLKKNSLLVKIPEVLSVVDPEEIVQIKWATKQEIMRIPEKDKNSPMRQWLKRSRM